MKMVTFYKKPSRLVYLDRSLNKTIKLRILIVTGEYPPMKGGVGRYTFNLVDALRKKRILKFLLP